MRPGPLISLPVQPVLRNLRRVIGGEASGGELRALSREAMRSYARYWLEVFRLPVMPGSRLAGGMRDTACDEDRYRILSQSIRSGRRPVAGGRLVVR